MSAAPMAQTPVVPARPGRSTDKEASSGPMPRVPPRPGSKRIERSVSPGVARFAESPFSRGIPNSTKDARTDKHYANKEHASDPIERAGSVPMPSVGEEGMEYSAVTREISNEDHSDQQAGSAEQTRLVAEDLQLHAPKPSLPASSAKQQVQAVTRTDSDRAAAYGIGQSASSDERATSRGSMRKRPESSYSAYSDQHTDDEHGIPNIGQRVPMNRFLGDVQAPSPDSGADTKKKHHTRKHSGRNLPPGSYGLHGHGLASQDKLDKEYYQKHPDLLEREHHTPIHDRQNDYAMSSSDLNRLVRDTPSRKVAQGYPDAPGTPSDDVAFRATEEFAKRSSRPTSMSSAQGVQMHPLSQVSAKEEQQPIHVDDARNPEFYNYGEEKVPGEDDEDYTAPILASDEVQKEPVRQARHPAIRPHLERRGSSNEESSPSRPTSRPRIHRMHSHQQQENEHHTPLEDVKEYEPLFSDEAKPDGTKLEKVPTHEEHHHFPSKDIWEDAPNSVHYTAEVSTPDLPEPERRRSSAHHADRPITPAQAFAMYQEELAEKEAKGRSNFLQLAEDKPTWVSHQPHLVVEQRSPNRRRFPSRDIWEDAPESHIHEAELSEAQAEVSKPSIPARPAKKPSLSPERPAVPSRPKPRQGSGDDATKTRPPVSDKPKPQIPARPSKSLSGDSSDGASVAAASKPKPPVPSRPAGNKIAALQAGFMSDLNKRLQLGPQGVKKEDSPKEEDPEAEKEKVPLSDARKGRARGPQRRAPPPASAAAASTASSTDSTKAAAPVLAFSMPKTLWSMDPEDGDFQVTRDEEPAVEAAAEPPKETIVKSADSSRKLTESPAAVEAQAEVDDPVISNPVEVESFVAEPPAAAPLPKTEAELTPVATEPFAGPAVTDEPKLEEPTEEPKEASKSQHKEKELTLAANTAGESILEADVHAEGAKVEPDDIHEDVKA